MSEVKDNYDKTTRLLPFQLLIEKMVIKAFSLYISELVFFITL